MFRFNYLHALSGDYFESIYQQYLADPAGLDESWQLFFDGMAFGQENQEFLHAAGEATSTVHASDRGASTGTAATSSASSSNTSSVTPSDRGLEIQVAHLILAYREKGKRIAQINPLFPAPNTDPLLVLGHYGLDESHLQKKFFAGHIIGLGEATLQDILNLLKATYCGSVAVEVQQVESFQEREWIQKQLESRRGKPQVTNTIQKHILKRLTQSETFERFIHTRYVAQKRFSIEGGEALIPGLDAVLSRASEHGCQELVLGMAHRGRLNALVNFFGQKAEEIFTQFEDQYPINPEKGDGDVKYHMGYSSELTSVAGKKVHGSMAFNPSHLEFVNPVVEGMARAKQDLRNDSNHKEVIAVLIHGDAAFAGQGVVYETLTLSQLEGFKTGGTIHIVANNQVGFTTSPKETRSTPYCTDLAKMLEVPIFHVNGDDPEALWSILELAVDYRYQFKKDVVIDLVCYRKYGHNEGDEPSFTQPLLYQKIANHPTPREVYTRKLLEQGAITAPEAEAYLQNFNEQWLEAQRQARENKPAPTVSVFEGIWKGFRKAKPEDFLEPINTTVKAEVLRQVSTQINQFPAGFKLHSKLTRFFEGRLKAIQDGKGIDWGNAETLAYATLLQEGHSVRMTGQDIERGTFTHRHAVLHDFETDARVNPIAGIAQKGAAFRIHNSNLTETGAMGFEYGYASANPKSLVIWEAQFGDFCNGAQVIIDQFLAASESKWMRSNGLVLLLPHGYEGQGPEHSSARFERFLQLSAKNNWIVCNLTTPAQIFHALRRQIYWPFRKPLVIMSPKSLLRHPKAISTIEDLSERGFQEVLVQAPEDAKKVKRVLLCTGKVYYDLMASLETAPNPEVAVVRIEQLFPWPENHLARVLKDFSNATEWVWVQEEPQNMGAWTFVAGMWNGILGRFQKHVGNTPIQYVGREVASSPAVGSHRRHTADQKALVEQAIRGAIG